MTRTCSKLPPVLTATFTVATLDWLQFISSQSAKRTDPRENPERNTERNPDYMWVILYVSFHLNSILQI